jgi:diguanylate cyclase
MFKFLTRGSDAAAASEPASSAGDGSASNIIRAARHNLIEQIGEFLIDTDLDITPENLARAHAAFSGTDLGLAGQIAQRQRAGEKIDQAWLDAQRAAEPKQEPDAQRERAEIDTMMTRLDSSLASFTAASSRAHGATAAYGQSLSEHVGQITAQAPSDDVMASLVDIARAMLDRTREIEQEMKKSSQEASSLRESLERARRDAEIDHLTGLPNRRAFEGVLEVQYREAQQEIDLLTVAICDIDHFKLVNDNHGHETGDRVIQAIGQVLARISDDRCHVARHGGEEFVMLFRGRSVNEAKAMLDEAREQLAERRFINRVTDEPIGRITFSGGVANVFGWADPREALAAADQALYAAKGAGRNQICLAAK